MKPKHDLKTAHAEEVAALNAKHAKDLAELEQKAKIEAALPDVGYPVYMVHLFDKSEPHVAYQVRELADVLKIVDAYDPRMVAYEDAKASGCRVLMPAALMKPEYRNTRVQGKWLAPILRFHAFAECGSSADFEFWARVGGRLFRISISNQFQYGAGAFGFWASCNRRELFGKSVVEPGSWRAPKIDADDVVKWASGSSDSAQWSIRWKTLERFREVIGKHVAARAKAAQEARERATADYQCRRKPAEIEAHCRLVLDTLNSPEVARELLKPLDGWTLDHVRRVGYAAISKAVNKAAPAVLKVGIHDFLNTLYFLSADTDDYEQAPDYRDDVRAIYKTIARFD